MVEIAYAAGGGAAVWLVTMFLKKSTIGTDYRTQSQCEECSVRQSMAVIRSLVIELAIKAGVRPQEIAKIVNDLHGGKVD